MVRPVIRRGALSDDRAIPAQRTSYFYYSIYGGKKDWRKILL